MLSRACVALRWFVDVVGDLTSPPSCAACEAPVRTQVVFCATCAAAVERCPIDSRRVEHPLDLGARRVGALSFGLYGGPLADGIRKFKYDGRSDLARPFGALLRQAVREAGWHADAVVPVPMHPRRLAERGYNQAALLARAVARELDAPMLPRALLRTRNAAQQAKLSKAERFSNLQGAFVTNGASRIGGSGRVVLVDDVMTTGATVHACSEVLLAAGAASVAPLVLARVP